MNDQFHIVHQLMHRMRTTCTCSDGRKLVMEKNSFLTRIIWESPSVSEHWTTKLERMPEILGPQTQDELLALYLDQYPDADCTKLLLSDGRSVFAPQLYQGSGV